MAVGLPLKTTYADGDVYSASDVNDTNGTVNLLTSTTLSVAAGKNVLINGGMDIWQRGTTFTGTTTAFCADRWQAYRATTGSTFSRQVTNDTTNLPFIQYCTRVSRDSGNASTTNLYFFQNVETVNAIPFAGKAVTLSFYARRGANYSAASNALAVSIITGTGTDQNIGGGYTGQATAFSGTATLTTTWQRFSFTGTIAATAREFVPFFDFVPVGTAGAADFYEITGVQLEVGSVPTSFSRAGGTIQGELAACQRYYYRPTGGSTYSGYAVGVAATTTVFESLFTLPVTMRIEPTSVDFANLGINVPGVAVYTVTAAVLNSNSSGPNYVGIDVTSSSLVALRPGFLANNNNVNGYLGVSAEL
jgi:hypothetical protein